MLDNNRMYIAFYLFLPLYYSPSRVTNNHIKTNTYRLGKLYSIIPIGLLCSFLRRWNDIVS